VLWSDIPASWLVGLAVALGLLFGSFLNVVIYRVPRGQSVAFPPSTCPGCGARIRPFDNVPVLSWLWLRGRARCCGVRISARYPSVELLGGLIALALMNKQLAETSADTPFGIGFLLFAVYLAMCLGLLAALFIDLEFMILPDSITLGGTVVALASVPVRGGDWQAAVVGGAVGFLMAWLPFDRLYRLVRGQPGMGLGDAKLLMLAGAWLGWEGAVFALLAGAVQGTLVAIAVFVAQGKIEEPKAIQEERASLKRELAELGEAEREALQAELAGDILASEPEQSFGKARLAFGPFLILAMLEFFFFGDHIRSQVLEFMWQA
jgi:leader peptidase (prepilin peptidase) / N-methyltransferase